MYTAQLDFDELIREDVPYFDLTSFELGIDREKAQITVFTREDCVVCGTEEAKEIFARLHIEVQDMKGSGTEAKAGDELISGIGDAVDVLTAWKVVQNLIDHTSGIATKTRRMVRAVRSVNRDVSVLTTRKMFSGTKALAIKAVMAGGALPHRLGLSETILIFKQHVNLLGGMDRLLERIPEIKRSSCEKKVLVETDDKETALKLLGAGADGIQFEKLKAGELKDMVNDIRRQYSSSILLAAGGINENNASEYAGIGINGIVTTSLYTAPATDIGVRIVPV